MALSSAPAVGGGTALGVRIRKQFGAATSRSFALNISFSAPAGITILFGASGAGKTTLLDCIAGLQTPDQGSIAAGDTKLFDSEAGVHLPPQRRNIGYLFQTLALFPHMTVQQNVKYGLASLDRLEQEQRSSEVLESFHIASFGRRRPGEISGGERQRVALARTLVTRPRVLLLDEPLTALDAVTKASIIDDLRAWNQRLRIPILYVTHDREEVYALGERVIVLESGRLIAEGTPHDVLRRPQLESVAQLVGFENIFECAVGALHPEQGTMTCRIAGSPVEIEAPLTRIDSQCPLRLGIRAGDILVAQSRPEGLSARNMIAGVVRSMEQRDVTAIVVVDCAGVMFEVHLTPGAVRSLRLSAGAQVWLVIKTYSCHVMQ
jgi:molybdate transport system ATP-binding protein